jgi:zinc protease
MILSLTAALASLGNVQPTATPLVAAPSAESRCLAYPDVGGARAAEVALAACNVALAARADPSLFFQKGRMLYMLRRDEEAATAYRVAAGEGERIGHTPLSDHRRLVGQVRLPYETFTLANGLRVVVHEDRSAPVVAVNISYNVGSKDEPPGRTGFAHLFEHLMFEGSENAPETYDHYTATMGATNVNAQTSFDHTTYFETVPREALERALFLESDRMGRLLGAVTQQSLTNQIGIVQNEKRERDNQPNGLILYSILETLFPDGHPYRHAVIGSMADLDSASLDDVRAWFRDKYGINNAVLVLAGDVNAAEARPLVERHFGPLARGPVNAPAEADVPVLPRRIDQAMTDRIANTGHYRFWPTPGMLHEDSAALFVAATILGTLNSSLLDNVLVRREQSAARVTAYTESRHRVGWVGIEAHVRPGGDADALSRRLDEVIADFVEQGPSDDDVRRAVASTLSGEIERLDTLGERASVLAEGMLWAGDPGHYRRHLEQIAHVTPAHVRAAMRRWLTKPVYALRVNPGERAAASEEAAAAERATGPEAGTAEPRPAGSDRLRLPPIEGARAPVFPRIERARLSNGIPIVYVRRSALPLTMVAVDFDAGHAAEPAGRIGTQALMLRLMTEGTRRLDSAELAEAQERLGARIGVGASLDISAASLTTPTTSLGPSLDLLADIVRDPAFAPAEVERIRQSQLATIANELTDPNGLAGRALPVHLFGGDHPYGRPETGTGDPAVVASVTRDELVRFHRTWIRPDNATIFAVSDLPLAEIAALLEARFGDWRPPAVPRGIKRFPAPGRTQGNRIILVNRPQSPQSVIYAGQLLDIEGTADTLLLGASNRVLGSEFESRINMDLRETRGWSYGAFGILSLRRHQVPYVITAPVQADRTADSIRVIGEQIETFLRRRGVTADEAGRVVESSVRELPARFLTSATVLDALRDNAIMRRPDDYWRTLPGRYRAMTAPQLDAAMRSRLRADGFVWVVVGDASVVRPQLATLGMPIEEMRLAMPPPTPNHPRCSRTVTDRCLQRGVR